MPHMLDEMVPARRYLTIEDDDGNTNVEETNTFIATEADDGEVTIHFSPGTADVESASMSPAGAWFLIRQLAAAAVAAESE